MKGEHEGRHQAEAMKKLNYSSLSCLLPVLAQLAFLLHPELGRIIKQNACQTRPQANMMETFSQKRFPPHWSRNITIGSRWASSLHHFCHPQLETFPYRETDLLDSGISSSFLSPCLFISPVTMHPHDRTYQCLHLQYQRTANTLSSSHSLKWSIHSEWMNEVKWYSE